MRTEFTGRHMAAVMVAGFGIVIAVNFTMAALASSTFGGLVVENSYVASQNFNGWLEEARKSESLGWDVDLVRRPDGHIQVLTGGVPGGGELAGEAWHPLGQEADHAVRFKAAGDGSYLSTAPLPAGRWLVRLELTAGGKIWRGERALQ